ncbi:MAG TPA: tRNA pseudouridine(38-40) synthase TruA [Oscillospiraceae bacterium]|nr:tRNA pseudouridine(38-40) synthase TruA [Oscillospiraceae bacterium]
MTNYKLTLCYDGTGYNGWQRQGNTKNTLQETLETALAGILGAPAEAAASGRTDEGVHALGQVVSFRADTALPTDEILCQLRSRLPADMGALSLEIAPPRFHARLSCKGKIYVYRVWNSVAPCVFERRYVYQVPEPLDEPAMRAAAAALCGTHDYRSFCAAKKMKHSTVRTVESIDLTRRGHELRLTFTGDGFLYNMVRILTGTLLDVGLGRRSAAEMPAILAAGDRAAAGPTAPARGLFLESVRY